jgi:hypothetical protein
MSTPPPSLAKGALELGAPEAAVGEALGLHARDTLRWPFSMTR